METQQSTTTISVSDLKKIHDVASSTWKTKIAKMVKPFQDEVILSKSQIDEMFGAASRPQTIVLEEVFGKRNTDNLFDFSDRFTISQTFVGSPIHIRHGYATYGNENKEIGFCDHFTPIIVIDGKEIELKSGEHGAYLKFKTKQNGKHKKHH